MQKQTFLKLLTFVLGVFTLVAVGEISANQLSANLTSSEAIVVNGFKNLSKITTKAGDEIKIVGKNFGNDVDDLEIVLNGESYDVEASYGNEIILSLDSEMSSGDLFVQRTIEIDDSTYTLESNAIELDLGTPLVTKINAPDGLIPKADLQIFGSNLGSAVFFCSDSDDAEALDTSKQENESVTLELPSEFTECELRAKDRGFEFVIDEDFTIAAPIVVSAIEFSGDAFRVLGKNFGDYENNLDDLELACENDASLTNATYVNDGELSFAKSDSTVLPNAGWAVLEVGEKTSPQFEYIASGQFPQITELKNLSDAGDGDTTFQIGISGSVSVRSGAVLSLNGSEIEFSGSTVTMSSKPASSGEAWLEKDGWESRVFHYDFEDDLKPKVTEIQVDASARSLEIFGRNFGEKANFDVSGLQFDNPDLDEDEDDADQTEKSWLQRVSDNSAIVNLPFSTGTLSVSVSNRWGSSNSVQITLPAEGDQSFYPTPEIDEIEALDGLAPNRNIAIHGDNLLNVYAASFAGKQAAATVKSLTTVEVTIPSTAPLEGELTVLDKNGNESSSLTYELLSFNQLATPSLEFPSSTNTSALVASDDWQDVFAFTFSNSLKTLDMDLIEFNFDDSPLPFTEFRLLDTNDTVLDEVDLTLDQEEEKLKIGGLTIDPSVEKVTFTLQAKVFQDLASDEEFIFSLGNTSEKSGELVSKNGIDKKITVAGGASAKKFCLTYDESKETWKKCKIQRPTSDVFRNQ